MSTSSADVEVLSKPLTLPNGRVIPNRLVKVAMDEGIGYGGGLPDRRHRRLYRRWVEGGWGMIITGNVQVDPRFLATPHCRTFSPDVDSTVKAYSYLRIGALVAPSPTATKPIMLLQLSHPGLQSPATYTFARWPWVPAVGPSSARPDTGSSLLGRLMGHVLWPKSSREIIDFDEWLEIVDQFVHGAKVAEEAGWDGVQLHSAHGYLLASYLSPHTNPYPKPLPGVPCWIPLRLHLLWLVLDGIHRSTSSSFIKAVKINSSDFVQGGLDEEQSTDIIKEIVSWQRVDMLEVSGGSYSNPVFGETTPSQGSDSSRQSLFAHFTANLLPQLPAPPEGPAILLTGGLHSRRLAADCVRQACHLAGVGRPACLHPKLPVELFLNPEASDEAADVGRYVMPGAETMKWLLGGGSTSSNLPKTTNEEAEPLLQHSSKRQAGIPLVGAGVSTLWHEWQLCRMGRGVDPDPNMNWLFGGFLGEGVWWGMLGGGPIGWGRSWARTKDE